MAFSSNASMMQNAITDGDKHFKNKAYDLAIDKYKEALALCRSVNGNVHQATSKLLRSLSTCYNNQKDYINALPYLKENVTCLKALNGENNRNYIIELNDYALNYYRLKRYREAIPFYLEAIRVDKKFFPDSHKQDEKTFHSNIILCYEALGDFAKIRPLQKHVTELLTSMYGTQNDLTLESRSQELYFMCKLKLYGEAVPKYAILVKYTEECKGKNSRITLRYKNSFALCLMDNNQTSKSLPLFETVLKGLYFIYITNLIIYLTNLFIHFT